MVPDALPRGGDGELHETASVLLCAPQFVGALTKALEHGKRAFEVRVDFPRADGEVVATSVRDEALDIGVGVAKEKPELMGKLATASALRAGTRLGCMGWPAACIVVHRGKAFAKLLEACVERTDVIADAGKWKGGAWVGEIGFQFVRTVHVDERAARSPSEHADGESGGFDLARAGAKGLLEAKTPASGVAVADKITGKGEQARGFESGERRGAMTHDGAFEGRLVDGAGHGSSLEGMYGLS